MRKAIKEDGGIPGLKAFADEIATFSDLRESSACFNASHIFFVEEETYIRNILSKIKVAESWG